MSADPLTDNPFDRYRERVDRPLWRLFRTYGGPRLEWFGVGMVANLFARGASLLPPLVLGAAIDALFSRPLEVTMPMGGWESSSKPRGAFGQAPEAVHLNAQLAIITLVAIPAMMVFTAWFLRTGWRPTGPRSPSPTGSRQSGTPIQSWCSRTGRWSSGATTTSCSTTASMPDFVLMEFLCSS